MKSGIYTVSHGAHIYYEREGKGRPIAVSYTHLTLPTILRV